MQSESDLVKVPVPAEPFYKDDWLEVWGGDCREVMASMEPESVHCVVTSPPYWGLRDYGVSGQLGLEPTPEEYVENMVAVFREVWRVMRPDATLWLNLGDSYANDTKWGGQTTGKHARSLHGKTPLVRAQKTTGLKAKDLVGIPWRVAFALQADGWYLRSDIIWSKPNPMPESVTDRPTKSHEYLFLLSKSPRYYFDADAVREGAQYAGPNGPQHSPYGQGFTRRSDKQRESLTAGVGNGHHVAGLNDRWDESERVQRRRAIELAEQAGLTDAHIAAIRSVGITDTDKARVTQDGTGKNDAAVQALADEAKVALGGYYREFLVPLRRNIRSVWTVATQPYPGAHFATFPEKLIEPPILAGCPTLGVVLDPFAGSGTVGRVAQRLSRRAVLIDLNPDYLVQVLTRNAGIPLGLETA